MVCFLAEKFQQPPSKILKWRCSDAMLMVQYYKEQQEKRGTNQPDLDTPERMARTLGVEMP